MTPNGTKYFGKNYFFKRALGMNIAAVVRFIKKLYCKIVFFNSSF